MAYIKEEEIVKNKIKLSKAPIYLDKYDMYYVEFLMRSGQTKKVRVFCEKGTFPEFNSTEFKRLQQIYGSKLLTDFFVKRLIGEQGLMNKEGRDDFIYLGGELYKNGYIANRHMIQSNGKTGQQNFDENLFSIKLQVQAKENQNPMTSNEKAGKTYVIGEILDSSEDLFGLVVEAEYSDGSKQTIELNELEIEDVTFSKKGTQAIKIGYRGKEASFDVNVRNMKFQVIGIKQEPKKTEYNKGDKLDITGLELYVNNEYSEIIVIDASLYDEITYSPMELNEVGTQKVIVKHEDDGDDITFNVTVKETQNQQNTDDSKQQEKDNSNQNNGEKSNEESKDNNSNDSQNDDEKNNSNSKQNDNNVSDKSTNGDADTPKDTTTSPSGYKDANTANSKLPQTGVTQIIIVMLVACAVVSGALFIKYRKI